MEKFIHELVGRMEILDINGFYSTWTACPRAPLAASITASPKWGGGNGQADVHRLSIHFHGQCRFAN